MVRVAGRGRSPPLRVDARPRARRERNARVGRLRRTRRGGFVEWGRRENRRVNRACVVRRHPLRSAKSCELSLKFALLPSLPITRKELGFVTLTDIQRRVLPALLAGQSVVGVAERGDCEDGRGTVGTAAFTRARHVFCAPRRGAGGIDRWAHVAPLLRLCACAPPRPCDIPCPRRAGEHDGEHAGTRHRGKILLVRRRNFIVFRNTLPSCFGVIRDMVNPTS